MRFPLTVLGTALALVLAVAPAAAAQTTATRTIDQAAEALGRSPVYVDPQAENALDPAEARVLREQIARTGAGPMYIAIFPGAVLDEAGGSPDAVGQELAERVGERAVYGVVVGNTFRAGNVGVDVPAARFAGQALEAHGEEGVAPTLEDFVSRVGEYRQNGGSGSGSGSGGGGSGAGDGGGAGGVLLALLAGGGGLLLLRRRRRQKRAEAERQEEFAEVKETARDDLVALGDDIRALDLDVQLPDADPAGKQDYEQAVRCYERASSAFDSARTPEDLEKVSTALEEGRYAMASAKARLAGAPPPQRRPPCFFDPRHGPSTRDVEWAPSGGQPRLVPACEADALRLEEGQQPATREVMVRGQATPYYDAPPAYGPYAGGFFGGVGGGLLPGLLLGSMLGGGMGFGYPGDAHAGEGDFGGGDFGGGDFGGGDFGGGDFGGGDFGGGGE